jgi:hypothetical protein
MILVNCGIRVKRESLFVRIVRMHYLLTCFFRLAQRAFAALLAMALRRAALRVRALASPPFLPSETAAGSFSFAMQ